MPTTSLAKGNAKNKTWQRPPLHFSKSHLRQVSAVSSQQQSNDSSSEDEYLYTLEDDLQCTKTPEVQILLNGIPIEMIIDTGAATDIIDEGTFSKINQNKNIKLECSTKNLF